MCTTHSLLLLLRLRLLFCLLLRLFSFGFELLLLVQRKSADLLLQGIYRTTRSLSLLFFTLCCEETKLTVAVESCKSLWVLLLQPSFTLAQ
jgi:hypothetical protein